MTTSLKTSGRRLIAFFLVLTVAFAIGGLNDTPARADAAEAVTLSVVDKAGETQPFAEWTYDSINKTYMEQDRALDIVKDFTAPENLSGEINGYVYDFTDIGAFPYTGISKKQDPRCLAVTTKGILLEDLYDYAEEKTGMDLRGDTKLYMADSTGFNDTFTYDQYWGLARYYYPDWYDAETYSETDMGATERYVPTTLAISGCHNTITDAHTTTDALISASDDSNSLRISSGMQKDGNKTIEEIEGTTYNQGDINEGKLSVRNISQLRFTPVYNMISIVGGTAKGTEGKDMTVAVGHAVVKTNDCYYKAAKGEKVFMSVKPENGYQVSKVTAIDEAGGIAVTKSKEGYSFEMSDSAVKVKISVKKSQSKKLANPMTVKTAKKTVKALKLKTKKQIVKAITVKKAAGKVSFRKIKGSAKLRINVKNGKITVKKGTKKGIYKARVKVSASGNTRYKSASKKVLVTITVK